jgi:hypothetical protein
MDHQRTDPRTDRLGVLLDQLDFAREIAQARLDGLASPASLPKGAPLAPRNRLDPALLVAASKGGALDLLADYASFPGGQAARRLVGDG